MKELTESQIETIRFYTTNDYLLINGLLWGEKPEVINEFIDLINTDGRAVMKEAEEMGFDVRWNCDKSTGEKLYKTYQKRFPVIENDETKKEIIERAKTDIANLFDSMGPLDESMTLYRNVKAKFVEKLKIGDIVKYLGFSSCSLAPHIAENAMYGSGGCTMMEIEVKKGTPAIRLDRYPGISNEPDEVILAPIEYRITEIDRENKKVLASV